MDKKIYCKKCNSPVTKSELPEYSYQCANCDEDLYGFETYEQDDRSSYLLIDAKAQHEKTPKTFIIPDQSEIKNLQVGDFVKLGFTEIGFAPERMWVKITLIRKDQFQGILDNEPFSLEAVKLGDTVFFNSKHILSIL